MPRLYEVYTSFNSGEVDPRIRAQTDLKLHSQGLRRMRDLARLAGGGCERRPGTLDLADLLNKSRLERFDFSADQRYVVAFHHQRARVYDLNGNLLITFVGPWTADQVFEMSVTQSADVMIVAHHAFLVEIRRISSTLFDLTDFAFARSVGNTRRYQPYYKFAADDVTITPSASAGAGITLTASGTTGWGGFQAGHVGHRFRILDSEVQIVSVTSSTVATADCFERIEHKLDLDAFKTKQGTATIEVLHPFHGFATGANVGISGANAIGQASDGTGGIPAANLAGTFTITVVDEHRYTFTASGVATANVSEDGGGANIRIDAAGVATRSWLEPSISPVRGYPGAACFHEGRLWLAGTPSQPDGYFGSDALKHSRFDVGKGYDGQSVQGAAGLENLSSIRHLVSNGDLQLFTPTTEGIFITPAEETVTPSNQRVKRQSVAGASHVMPQVFDGATIFVQENGLSVSELVYQEVKGGYAATNVSAIAQHLIESGPVDAAITVGTTSRAEQYAFFPVGDGSIAVFHSMRSENIAGWGAWKIAGCVVHSVCCIGTDIYACVEREVDGAFRLYRFASEPTFYTLDGAVEHTATSETVNWTLDARVRNRRMHMYSNRGYLGEVDVPASGVITTSVPVDRLLVGDAFYAELETLTPRVELPNGVLDRLAKRIVRALIEFDETDSALVEGERLLTYQADGDPQALPPAFSGVHEARFLGYSPSPTVRITQDSPGFMRVLGMTLEVQA